MHLAYHVLSQRLHFRASAVQIGSLPALSHDKLWKHSQDE
ncbi:filamentation induced by cAMP protein Fic [Acetobacter orientalis]|uniref:Filamentation induced by cAMP protein Fic n=1 Tax=Acetobacter orientalis TaxID=146474 RepID=A0A2Z5ZHT1_9PROT|nr:filamentation induced by cAMP protein Fic [Acetobacter orientalis]